MRLSAVGMVLLLGAAACSGGAVETSVTMTDADRFVPDDLTLEADAETIVFVNESDAAHTVTAYEEDLPGEYFSSGGFASEEEARANVAEALIAPGGRFEVTLSEPGVYRYFCIPHEDQKMTGAITLSDN